MTDTAAAPRWIEYRPVDELPPAPRNAKAHDQAAMARSVEAFGFVEPCVLDERTGLLLGGHGRTEHVADLEAAGGPPPEGIVVRADGRWLIPVTRGWSSRDEAHADAAAVAINRVGELGGWRPDVLSQVLDDLAPMPDLFDAIGWTTDQLDDLIRSTTPGAAQPEPPVPPAPRQVAKRCSLGQVWQLGRHRLMCGDCRQPDQVARLLDGATVHLGFTSPPYAEQRKYDEATEFRPVAPEAYVDWFAPVAANVAAHLAPDGSWFVNIKPGVSSDNLDTELYVIDLVAAHVRRWGWHFATELSWERNGMPGQATQRFKNQFEPVYQFTRGKWKMRPQAVMVDGVTIIPLGPGTGASTWAEAQGSSVDGRTRFGPERREDGMAYPGNRLPTFAGSHEATGHEAAFPVGLPAWFMRAYTDEGDTVLDPFAGSGSTLLAAQQEGRTGYGMELSPRYCDIVLDRWERHTGVDVVLLDA